MVGTWFAPQRSHWAEAVLAMDVASVRTYLDQITQRLAWYDIPARGCPRLSGAGHPEGLVHRDQQAIVGQIDGRTTVAELAWRGGFALHETVESIGRLVHAGMCTVAAPDAVPAVPGGAVAGLAVAICRAVGGTATTFPRTWPRPTPLDLGRAAAGPAGAAAHELTAASYGRGAVRLACRTAD